MMADALFAPGSDFIENTSSISERAAGVDTNGLIDTVSDAG